ncbi:MAG: hypothetical protein Kow00128_16530 [Deltaproteobacteria bacterium]
MRRRTAGGTRWGLLSLWLLSSCLPIVSPVSTGPPVLAGRVTFRGAPVPGAIVLLYDRYDPPEKRIHRKTVCGADGRFTLPVAPGIYHVEASGRFEETEVFAFSGQNPIRLERGRRWLGMKAVPVDRPSLHPGAVDRGAVIEGTVLAGGKPVEGAYVYVYASPDQGFKGMGIAMSPATGPDGTFSVENLPESSYFLVARKRGAGGTTGPLERGDLYGFHPANPVYAKGGMITRVRIETVEKEKPLSYSEVTAGTETVLSGTVVDRSGVPQAGVYAFVYDDRVFGHRRPYGHSGRTGPDGTFTIHLDRGGIFYLGARENFGNSPRPGERFGFYEGTPDHSIDLREGSRVEGLVIPVDRILREER